MINPMLDITVSVHFELSNAEFYGGEGTVGYAASEVRSFKSLGVLLDALCDPSLIEERKMEAVKVFGVSPENIKVISKEQFDKAIENLEMMKGDSYAI